MKVLTIVLAAWALAGCGPRYADRCELEVNHWELQAALRNVLGDKPQFVVYEQGPLIEFPHEMPCPEGETTIFQSVDAILTHDMVDNKYSVEGGWRIYCEPASTRDLRERVEALEVK